MTVTPRLWDFIYKLLPLSKSNFDWIPVIFQANDGKSLLP